MSGRFNSCKRCETFSDRIHPGWKSSRSCVRGRVFGGGDERKNDENLGVEREYEQVQERMDPIHEGPNELSFHWGRTEEREMR
jgi:hypothetical protein